MKKIYLRFQKDTNNVRNIGNNCKITTITSFGYAVLMNEETAPVGYFCILDNFLNIANKGSIKTNSAENNISELNLETFYDFMLKYFDISVYDVTEISEEGFIFLKRIN